MKNSSTLRALMLIWLICLHATGCAKAPEFTVPKLESEVTIVTVKRADLPEYAPAFGIAVGSGKTLIFEVNIEKGDSTRVRPGEPAIAYAMPSSSPVPCKVTRVLRAVSAETGQSIAWLEPLSPSSIPPGEFVFSKITQGLRHQVLAVPNGAVFIREGKTWVVRREKAGDGKLSFSPVPVKAGISTSLLTEIISGLGAGDSVASSGGLGYLFPNFKSQGEGD